jgi:hypothetical protein
MCPVLLIATLLFVLLLLTIVSVAKIQVEVRFALKISTRS